MTDRPPPASSSDYADSVREVLERAAEVEATQAPAPPTKGISSPLLLGALALGLVAVVVYNIQFSRRTAAPLAPEEAELSSGISVMIATQAVEAYRAEHGALPESLEQLGFPEGSFVYSVSGNGYSLAASVPGADTVRFSSEQGPEGILRDLGVSFPPTGTPSVTPEGVVR